MTMTMQFARIQKSAAVFCCSIALLLLGAACSQQQPADTRAAEGDTIRNLDTQWSKTAASKDVEGTIAFYADDASVLPPNGPIVADKKAIRDSWAGLLGSITSLSWQPTKVEVARASDIAYTMGTYQLTMNDAQGKPTTDMGKYVVSAKCRRKPGPQGPSKELIDAIAAAKQRNPSKPGRPHKQSAPTSDDAVPWTEIGGAVARAIEDQRLMLGEDGLSNYGTGAARTGKPNNGREEMDEKDQQIAHFRIVARNLELAEFRPNQPFAMDRPKGLE
jgi:ketosteroid isomerase-like protein